LNRVLFSIKYKESQNICLPCLAKKLGTYSKPVQLKVQKTSNLLKEKVKHGNKKNKKKQESCIQKE